MPGAGSLTTYNYQWDTKTLKPPLMHSANQFRHHRELRKEAFRKSRKSRKANFHELLSQKSGVRKELIDVVIEALPLAVYEELNVYGDCHLDDFMTFTECSTPGRSMDACFGWRGAFKKAIETNWYAEAPVEPADLQAD